MSNYCATARSNYFAVRDEPAFRQWARGLRLMILEPCGRQHSADGLRRFGIASGNSGDDAGWPASVWSDEANDQIEIDLPAQLARHLADGEVAVLLEVGSEGWRYVAGHATAVNHRGQTIHLDLDAIHTAARALGPNVTRAEY